ncbi:MAG: sugar ABC transporter permease [Clostridia bacterium]|nr:sugar ABC transporter permease [Clostridia bacterium]
MKTPQPVGLNKKHRDKRDLIFYCALMILPLIQLCIFYFGVNFQTIMMAFQRFDVEDGYSWDLHSNINWFLNDQVRTAGFWAMVKNSFMIYLYTQLAGTVLAILFAYYIYKRHAGSLFFRFMLFLPSIIPAILLTVLYKKTVGLGVPAWLQYLFGKVVEDPFSPTADGNIRYTLITLFTVWTGFAAQTLIYSATMDRIDSSIIEAGKVDGASPWQEFRHIILPNILPAVSVFIITGIACFFTNDNNVFNFMSTSASPHDKTIGYLLYTLVVNGETGYCKSAFLGLICSIILIPVVTVVRKLLNREDD